jgi:hypothetical protein
MCVLKITPHFHFHFVDKRLVIANQFLNLPRPAQERTEFSSPPPDKRRLVLTLKTVPSKPRVFQSLHRSCAIVRGFLSQRPLVDQDDMGLLRMVRRFAFVFSRCSLSRHLANLRRKRVRETFCFE